MKLNYKDEKMLEIIGMLNDLKFTYETKSDVIDIKVNTIAERRQLGHELDKINITTKSPPLAMQFDQSNNTLSVFDRRL